MGYGKRKNDIPENAVASFDYYGCYSFSIDSTRFSFSFNPGKNNGYFFLKILLLLNITLEPASMEKPWFLKKARDYSNFFSVT